VRSETELEGITDIPAHAGRKGIHNARKVLEECAWEALNLKMKYD